jgi:DNA mismatch repair ATPase MutS
MFSNFGEHLRAFRDFDRGANGRVLNRLHALDALLSLLRLADEPGYCQVRCIAEGPPAYDARGLWHPCLDQGTVVRNRVRLGSETGRPGMVLTGPNAGGKSTLLKAMMIAALTAQSLTIAPCSIGMSLTPFAFLNSHVNVPDCKGRASLFEAEMYRARANLQALQDMRSSSSQGFSLLILDEVFSSTNALEGVAGAYAVAKRLVTHGDCICAVSTHYQYLCLLAKRTGLYRNYRMPVRFAHGRQSPAKEIIYPYRLQRGVCDQFIALDLLRKHKFDPELLRDAEDVKEELLRQRHGKRAEDSTRLDSTEQQQAPCPGAQPLTRTRAA